MAKRPTFGFWTLVFLVIANMIGAGVFTTSGFTLASVGSPAWVMVAWLIAGVIAICGALSYGSLIRLIPEDGGEYLFLARTYGPLWGFLAGWVSLVAGFTGAIAFAATTFESYVLPQGLRPAWLPPDVLACGAIAAAGLAHGLRVKLGATVQNLVVILKLVLIGIFIWMAATNWNQNVWSGAATGRDLSAHQDFWLSLATSIMWISLSYSGFNAAVYVAEESKSVASLVPRALLVGTLSVFAIYLTLNFIFVYAPSYEVAVNQREIAAIAAQVVGGSYGEAWVRGIIVFAQLTSITAMIMAAPRVYAKMAQEGLLPARLRFEGEAPRIAIVAQVVLAMAIVLVSTLQELLNYLSVTLSLSAAATVACLFVRRGELSIAGRLILIPAGLYVACTVFLATLMAIQKPANLLGTAITVATGMLIYFLFVGKRIRRAEG